MRVLVSVVIFLCMVSCVSNEPVVNENRQVYFEIDCGSKAHFRGIQAVSDELVWLSGTDGTVLKTENGGLSWEDVTVPECEGLDFRDIHALDKKRAWVMSSGNGVRVYYTKNGGKSWELQFEDKNPKVFLDGMDFSDEMNGIIYGDPISGVMDALITSDGGKIWQRIDTNVLPKTIEGEAGFAASGTGVVYEGKNIWMATGGGEKSRIIRSKDMGVSWEVINTPILGGEGAGIFSMAFKDNLQGVVVGGDYVDSTSVKFNCAFTIDGGNSWELVSENGPRGYRSCVAIAENGMAIACGRTGIDKSYDFKNWSEVSDDGYFTCSAGESYVWFAGRRGKVGKMIIN